MAFQNVIIAIGGMVIQSVINGFGMLFVAGFTATNKLYGLLEVAATLFWFFHDNLYRTESGAGQYKRIPGNARRPGDGLFNLGGYCGCDDDFRTPILGLFISGSPRRWRL